MFLGSGSAGLGIVALCLGVARTDWERSRCSRQTRRGDPPFEGREKARRERLRHPEQSLARRPTIIDFVPAQSILASCLSVYNARASQDPGSR